MSELIFLGRKYTRYIYSDANDDTNKNPIKTSLLSRHSTVY